MFIVKLFSNKIIRRRLIYMEPQNKFDVKVTAIYFNECLLQQSLILFINDSIALLSCWVFFSSFSRSLLIRKSNSLKLKTKKTPQNNKQTNKHNKTKENTREIKFQNNTKSRLQCASSCALLIILVVTENHRW